MTRYAVDAGPLVALLNDRDAFHEWTRETLDAIEPPLRTCESVISEACFLLQGLRGAPEAVLALVASGVLSLEFHLEAEIASVRRLVSRYASVPMSVADASLVRMTELDERLTVITLDGDFRLYRRHGRQQVPVLMP